MAERMTLHIEPFNSRSNNVSESWRQWKSDFLNYIEANDLEKATEKRKIALFLLMCGSELKTKFGSFSIDSNDAEQYKLELVIKKFDDAFEKCSNEVFASYQFWNPGLKQDDGETFDSFYKKVRDAAVDCKFGAALSRNIRDKLVIGIRNTALRERLLREKDLNEGTVVEQCHIVEQSQLQSQFMSNNLNVEALHARQRSIQNSDTELINCGNCGLKHVLKQCPARGATCYKCGKKNHFRKLCKSQQRSRTVNEIQETGGSHGDFLYISEILIGDVSLRKACGSDWLVDVKFNDCAIVNCKVDTGAQANVMSEQKLNLLPSRPKVRKTDVILRAFGGSEIDLVGECLIPVELKNVRHDIRFLITKIDAKTILGLNASRQFGLINDICEMKINKSLTPEALIKEYHDVFTGNGSLKPVKIILTENAVPHISSARKLPIALQEPVRQELEIMVEEGVIQRVNEPTDWVNNFHAINKNGKLRIVLDPRQLNKCIKRAHFQIPTIDELLFKLSGCKIFTVFDAQKAFWQQPLDEESSLLTTFITPLGRFRYLKVPYGLINAPESFQSTMHEIFKEIPNVEPYFDDLVLGSKTMEEHLELIRKVLDTARKNHLKLNPTKIQLAKSKIIYLGHTLSDEGISPSQVKVNAILDYPVPKDKEALHRFLSMYKYHNKFVENASHKSHCLRQLLKKDAVWNWDANTQKCFQQLKKDLSSTPILKLFDPNKKTTLSVDASSYGLGAVLLQDGKPVAFGSASLTSTQQRYAQIEKELLAVAFGLQHFHFYTYGRKILVESDHKPLIGLKDKPFEDITPRLQRLLFKTLRYDYELHYIPGKELISADALSRAPQNVEFPMEEVDFSLKLNVNVLTTASDVRWNQLKCQTTEDGELKTVVNYIEAGWPESFKSMKENVKPFWHCKDELYISEGLVCRGQRLVIPKMSRQTILSLLHEGHNGIVVTKRKAREFFYWIGMDSDIERLVNGCDLCQKYQNSNPQEPMKERPIPTRPWERLGADFFEESGKKYLLIIDYFSKYIELVEMNSTTADPVIGVFKSVYAHHGFPDEVITDRGPPFYSDKFKKFHDKLGIFLNPSTPCYPKSNGMSERSVQSIKLSLKKSLRDGNDVNTVILNYNTTPHNDLKAPSELLFGRKLKTLLIVHPSHLKPNFPVDGTIQTLRNNQQKQKLYNDKNSKLLPDLKVNDFVWFQKYKGSEWFKGVITQTDNTNRAYTVKAENSRSYVRNRVFIRINQSENKNYSEFDTPENLYEANSKVDEDVFFDASDEPLPEEVAGSNQQINVSFTSINSSGENEASVVSLNTEEIDTSAPEVQSSRVTRSGREIKAPARFQGFDLF